MAFSKLIVQLAAINYFFIMALYVGNLHWRMRDNDLADVFSEYGPVVSAKIVIDNKTRRSKGFGFVEMSSAAEAEAAIAALNGKNVGGRDMTVNIARPMEPRSSNGGGGFRDSYGSGRRSY